MLLDPSQPDATEGALTVSAYKQLPDRGGKNATFIFRCVRGGGVHLVVACVCVRVCLFGFRPCGGGLV